jgi:hypothetical protein
MPRLPMDKVLELKNFIDSERASGCPVENCATLYNLIATIEDMNSELEQLRGLKRLQTNMISKAKVQSTWRREAIDLAIEALTEPTHRYRDEACKKLLKCLRNMSEIQPYDIAVDSDQLPF